MPRLFLILHILIAIGLQMTGYAYCLDPGTWGVLSLAGYAFPLFLVLSLLSLAVATCRYRSHLAVPFVSLVAAYNPVTLYCPVHTEQEVPEQAISVMTYNTHNWGMGDGAASPSDDADGGRAVMQYIAQSGADIVCLQESALTAPRRQSLDSIMNTAYAYYDSVRSMTHASLVIYSHFPIKRKQTIFYTENGNGSAAFWLDVNGREVVVVNNHLQSTGLSVEDRNKFSDMVHGRNDTIKDISRSVFSKLLHSTRRRVPQAQAVARFVNEQMAQGRPVIVCGDFNDIPHSYVHHVMAQDLTDCYQASATGPGYSFSRYGMRVRIDNVLCSPDITPYNFRTDNTAPASDHYPVTGKVTFAAQ
ncbi:MAG: endonuclease/exonuclease/phosphatase family protein [Prevotellaceae bacterium]|nr:endonuclease/exonuclease/phosphatase family protein [Prevotellaceae bacterium]